MARVSRITSRYNKVVVAGEGIAEGQTVCIASDGLGYRADADNAARMPCVGICAGTVVIGQNVEIAKAGRLKGMTLGTIGAECFVSATTGAITQSAPGVAQIVGYASSATEMEIAIGHVQSALGAGSVITSYLADLAVTGAKTAVNNTMRQVMSAKIDLSATAQADVPLLHAVRAVTLISATLLYVDETSSADAGSTIDIGKESDDDYFWTGATEASKAAWYEKTLTLLQTVLAAGDTLVYNYSQKTGAGVAIIVVEFVYTD